MHPSKSNLDPCRNWPISDMDGGDGWFSWLTKTSRLPYLDWQAMYSQANRVLLVFSDGNCNLLFDFGFPWGLLNRDNLFFVTILLRCLLAATKLRYFPFPISSTLYTVCVTSSSIVLLVSRLNRSPLSSKYEVSKSSNGDTSAHISLEILFWTQGYYSCCLWDFSLTLEAWSSFQIPVRHVISPALQFFKSLWILSQPNCATISFNQFICLFMALVDGQCREGMLHFLHSEMTFVELPIYFWVVIGCAQFEASIGHTCEVPLSNWLHK